VGGRLIAHELHLSRRSCSKRNRPHPVQRGLVASPELWRWSSFRAYFLGEAGLVRVTEWVVLKMNLILEAINPW
jgi:hypothetical protein